MAAWREDSSQRITDLLTDQFEGAAMITGWVVMVRSIDDQGVERIGSNTMDGQTATITLGLLEFGRIVERMNVEETWREGDDG